jgi:predicted acyltransferase
MERNSKASLKVERSLAIDVFRGISVSAMVFVNIVGIFDNTPEWSKHPSDFGLTYVDLVAPFFIFAISLTYHMSFNRRKEKYGSLEVYLQFIRRYGALFGFGFLAALRISSNGILFAWDVLQAIGFAGIITLFFINLRILARFIISIFFLILYQILSYVEVIIDGDAIVISKLILNDVHGGIICGFGWAILMLMTTVIGELFEKKDMKKIIIFGILFSTVGVVLAFIFGISKRRVNVSYITLSIGLGCILFCMLWWIYENKELTYRKSIIFQPQGKNAFALYVFHGALFLFTVILIPESIGWGIVLIIGFVNMLIIWAVAFILDRKKIYIII